MRFFVRNNNVWVEYWNPETKQNDRESLKLPAVDGWQTRYKKKLSEKKTQIEGRTAALKYGLRVRPQPKSVALDRLLAEFNEVNRMEAGLKSEDTLRHRRDAVRFLLKFKPTADTSHLTRPFFLKLRKWAESERYAPATIRGYFTEWRSLCTYAVRAGYLSEHPVQGIRISLPKNEPVPTPLPEQLRLLEHLWHHKRDLFLQLMFVRLTGAREVQSTLLKWSDVEFENGRWMHRNTKGNRSAMIPMQTPLRRLFEIARRTREPNDYVFHYRSTESLWKATKRVCDREGWPMIRPHKWKANYLSELDELDLTDRLLTIAAHHVSSGEASVVGNHYSRSRKRLLDVYETAQAHLTEFIDRLDGVPVSSLPHPEKQGRTAQVTGETDADSRD